MLPGAAENDTATPAEPLWVLLGARHGDNQQLLAIAEALHVPYRAIPLRFNRWARLPPALVGARRLTWRGDVPFSPPWPRVVLAAGRKSVAAARWIQRRSREGSVAPPTSSSAQAPTQPTRLVHVNRPRAPLGWFDLVVTTPQYALGDAPNVQANLMPFVAPPPGGVELPSSLREPARGMARPWTVVLVGGSSRPYVLDEPTATALAQHVGSIVREHGGSAWVLDSPRTPDAAMATLSAALAVRHVPATVVRWKDWPAPAPAPDAGEATPYAALRSQADRFVVTGDSASMLAEAIVTGRPVTAVPLPMKPGRRWRFAAAWHAAAQRAPGSWLAKGFDLARACGLSFRDVGLLQRALGDAGAFSPGDVSGGVSGGGEVDGDAVDGGAAALAQRERDATLARIAALMAAR